MTSRFVVSLESGLSPDLLHHIQDPVTLVADRGPDGFNDMIPGGGGGRLRTVLMRPTPQLSIKTRGGGGAAGGSGGRLARGEGGYDLD